MAPRAPPSHSLRPGLGRSPVADRCPHPLCSVALASNCCRAQEDHRRVRDRKVSSPNPPHGCPSPNSRAFPSPSPPRGSLTSHPSTPPLLFAGRMTRRGRKRTGWASRSSRSNLETPTSHSRQAEPHLPRSTRRLNGVLRLAGTRLTQSPPFPFPAHNRRPSSARS